MVNILRWGFIPSCNLHFASLQDNETRHDFIVQSFISQGWRPLIRIVRVRSDQKATTTFECSTVEAGKKLAEALARGVALEADCADRPFPVAIVPSFTEG